METQTSFELPQELDYRESDGIEVTLLWHRAENRVVVRVVDTGTDAWFELDVDPAEALEVFKHPYAYAAFRRVPQRRPTLESVGV